MKEPETASAGILPLNAEALSRKWKAVRAKPWIGDAAVEALPAGRIVLSVGEGYGEFALRIAQRRPDLCVIGTEIAVDRISHAIALRDRLGLKNAWFCLASAGSLPFAAGSFEFGYARGLLQILPDPLSAVAELKRVIGKRLLVDQLGNHPYDLIWFWLLQRYENLRAHLQGRLPNTRIWGDIAQTRELGGIWRSVTYYKQWFRGCREVKLLTNYLFVWETGTHHPFWGRFGYSGALDVHF